MEYPSYWESLNLVSIGLRQSKLIVILFNVKTVGICVSLIGLIINCLLGVSVTTVAQAERAQADGADYLGVGAMFVTQTKQDASYVSLQNIGSNMQSIEPADCDHRWHEHENYSALCPIWCTRVCRSFSPRQPTGCFPCCQGTETMLKSMCFSWFFCNQIPIKKLN